MRGIACARACVHWLLQAVATEEERVKQTKAEQQQCEAAATADTGEPRAADAADAEQQAGGSSKRAKKAGGGKKPSARPDRVAESSSLKKGHAVNRLGKLKGARDTFGHLPGIPINHV